MVNPTGVTSPTVKRIPESMKLRDKYGALDQEGNLLPFMDVYRRVYRDAEKQNMDEVQAGKFIQDIMTRMGYGETYRKEGKASGGKISRGRSAQGSAEKS